jgi:hypothetical protein
MIICFRERRYPSAGNLSEFELPIVLILKFEVLGQLGRTDDAENALDQALAISPTNFDFHVRTRLPWFSLEKHAHWVEGLRKAGLGKRSSTPYGLLSRLLLMALNGHDEGFR